MIGHTEHFFFLQTSVEFYYLNNFVPLVPKVEYIILGNYLEKSRVTRESGYEGYETLEFYHIKVGLPF